MPPLLLNDSKFTIIKGLGHSKYITHNFSYSDLRSLLAADRLEFGENVLGQVWRREFDDFWNAAQLQLADGECVAASEERNTDLFKAVPMR